VTGSGQSPLTPHSGPEHSITVLWWVMFGGACVGLTVITALLLLGWIRRNRAALPFGGSERAATRLVVGLGIATPIVLLSALFVWSDVFVIRTTAAPSPRSTAMTVHVVGRQWFWEIRYDGAQGSTANELHIPVRTRVNVVGTSADVIHSLWVPELNRKIDLIPGRTNRLLLYADRPGTYLGQCAEFCGLQHAFMGFRVIVQPEQDFAAWRVRQIQPAPQFEDALVKNGERVFLNNGCILCHTIRGTTAGGRAGPDLTHIGSRSAIAADTLPNTVGYLAGWIADPQRVKPGNYMPSVPLNGGDLNAMVHYLEALK
jgi:cytochrome c oxidase subunit II